jgi:nucleotide-binding universal stress UspA family protein
VTRASATLSPQASALRSIVVLADFSPKSDNAVVRAAMLAREHGAALRLLHVVAPRRFAPMSVWAPHGDDAEPRLARAQEALAALAARIHASHGVGAECRVRAGETLDTIVEEARSADLVVVAAKRSNPLRDFVLRTPTERLLRLLQTPMLVVKRAALADYTELLVPASAAWQGGVLATPIVREHSGLGDDLVVVPKDNEGARGKFLLGTLAQRLLAHAHCDVLVVPNRAPADAFTRSRAARRAAARAMGVRARPRPAA